MTSSASKVGESGLVKTVEIEGRGRALVASQSLRGGQIILTDSPILLYSAHPLSSSSNAYCSNCFRHLQTCSTLVSCSSCPCMALPSSDSDAPTFLHSLLSSLSPPQGVAGFSVELTTALLAKDKLNAFGLMEPPALAPGGERSVRAYGIYPKASFFNHDCLPNACRFDYVDTASHHNTDITIRLIHDVPEGSEICLSYFPVNETYADRQKRLLEDYGFTCYCDRCRVEANWKDDDEQEEEQDDEGQKIAGAHWLHCLHRIQMHLLLISWNVTSVETRRSLMKTSTAMKTGSLWMTELFSLFVFTAEDVIFLIPCKKGEEKKKLNFQS
ncbi:unnamed protein product, partial [Vitis vinifera]